MKGVSEAPESFVLIVGAMKSMILAVLSEDLIHLRDRYDIPVEQWLPEGTSLPVTGPTQTKSGSYW